MIMTPIKMTPLDRKSKIMYEETMFEKGKMFSLREGDFQVRLIGLSQLSRPPKRSNSFSEGESFPSKKATIYIKWFVCKDTECSLNIVFLRRFQDICRTLASLGFPSVSVCVYTMAGQTPALQQSSEK